MKRSFSSLSFAVALIACLAPFASADPIVGRNILKFQQRPMAGTPIPFDGTDHTFNGHDELSTAYSVTNAAGELLGYTGRFMADDFADHFDSPVVHVKWWGSYMNPPTAAVPHVSKFLISFEEDVPLGVPENNFPFSHPGKPLLNQIVTLDTDGVLTPGSGTFTEKEFFPVSVDGPIYEYNAELHLDKAFNQDPEKIYWLKIVALVDVGPNVPPELRPRWGWHNRDYTKMDPYASSPPQVVPGEHNQFPNGPFPIWHFQDDAVAGEVDVRFDPNDPMSFVMPEVRQFAYDDQFYNPQTDGPTFIGGFSKDLAFELYTVPEPAALFSVALAVLVIGVSRVHRRK